MEKLHFQYHMELNFDRPVIKHYYTMRCIPANRAHQKIYAMNCSIQPESQVVMDQTDSFENQVCIGCIEEPHEYFCVQMEGIAFVQQEQKQAEPCHPTFCYPSEYTRADDRIRRMMESARTGVSSPGGRAENLMDVLYQKFSYQKGATNIKTTASEALAKGAGVCQDYAHILIALLRTAGIPARYIAGIMIGEGATHAWVEYYDGTRWIGLDPTNHCYVDDSYIEISRGRDYGDCIVDRGRFTGNAIQTQYVLVKVDKM